MNHGDFPVRYGKLPEGTYFTYIEPIQYIKSHKNPD